MSKYIDADKLFDGIERRIEEIKWSIRLGNKKIQKSGENRLAELELIKTLIPSLQQEQPMPDSTKLIELWHEDKEMLKEKDFRDDPWRLAYNAFMCGFGRGIAVKKHEQSKVDLVAELKHHLATTPKEQLEKEWKELEPWCNIGPSVREFLYGKQPEVDLEKEVDKFLNETGAPYVWCNDDEQKEWCNIIARHFYELGLNARKDGAK